MDEITYICRNCKSLKSKEEAKSNTITKKGICLCKKCNSEMSYQSQLRKQVNIMPDRYLTCDDCDRYFSKYSKYKNEYGQRLLLVNCPYCNSENIDRVY